MHELAITQDVLNVVLQHAQKNNTQKVLRVFLRVGEMRDIDEGWFQRFFDYLSKGTVAEGATVQMERCPVSFRCACNETFPVALGQLQCVSCPRCGGNNVWLISGREFEIRGMEVGSSTSTS